MLYASSTPDGIKQNGIMTAPTCSLSSEYTAWQDYTHFSQSTHYYNQTEAAPKALFFVKTVMKIRMHFRLTQKAYEMLMLMS